VSLIMLATSAPPTSAQTFAVCIPSDRFESPFEQSPRVNLLRDSRVHSLRITLIGISRLTPEEAIVFTTYSLKILIQ
jgi:hypothetical protein